VVDRQTGNTALIIACAKDHATVATLLLRKGANVTSCNFKGNNALFVAKSPVVARALIAAGADATLLNYVKQAAGVFESAEAKAERLGARTGASRHGRQGGVVKEQGPPRGFAKDRRRPGRANMELMSTLKKGPPGDSRGLHFGSDRAEMVTWNSGVIAT
jgi:hypothetical protein